MEKATSDLTAEALRKLLDYDQETGRFTWRETRAWNAKRGSAAGTAHPLGYVQIRVCGYRLWAHRLAWLHVYGEWPVGEIDHINGDASDNRIANLRRATRRQNLANTKRRSNNSSGVKGVTWHKHRAKWAAQIMVNGKHKCLGLFCRIEDAAEAYRVAAEEHNGLFARVK